MLKTVVLLKICVEIVSYKSMLKTVVLLKIFVEIVIQIHHFEM